MRPPTITLPAPEVSDLRLAQLLAELDNETGGCLNQRQKRAARVRSLVAEQDRRTAEALWLLPVAVR